METVKSPAEQKVILHMVIEVDITSPSLSRFPIDARLGVPEVWRYDGEGLSVFALEDGGYGEAGKSAVLAPLMGGILSRLIERSKSLGIAAWLDEVVTRCRENAGPPA